MSERLNDNLVRYGSTSETRYDVADGRGTLSEFEAVDVALAIVRDVANRRIVDLPLRKEVLDAHAHLLRVLTSSVLAGEVA